MTEEIKVSLMGAIAGAMFQLCSAYFLFMGAVFAGAGYANGNKINKVTSFLINSSFYVLPAVCVVVAGWVVRNYRAGNEFALYWHLSPVLLAIAYYWAIKISTRY